MTAGTSSANTSSSSSNANNNSSPTSHSNNEAENNGNNSNIMSGVKWSGLETPGMREARCSLLIQEEVPYGAKIKALPKQRVLVYQDKGFGATSNGNNHNSNINTGNGNGSSSNKEDNFYVDFKGATILQLEPGLSGHAHKTMPVTVTVGGRCIFTAENYHDFRVMMRTKAQSKELDISPNGNFDWPDVSSLLLCPCCGRQGSIPQPNSRKKHEYWMVFFPLLQVTVMKGSQMTLGTRTICRLTCLDCMEDLLDGLTLTIQPGGTANPARRTKLCFSLPAADVLAEAGSASFLEDGPSRPDTHPHVDDILDAWTLYNLWEHSGAWEALQNDYRIVLSRSMDPEGASNREAEAAAAAAAAAAASATSAMAGANGASCSSLFNNSSSTGMDVAPRLKERLGKACGNPGCGKVHGETDDSTGEMIRLPIKCRECLSEYYCTKACRDAHAQGEHRLECQRKQVEREERREKKAKRVSCDMCGCKFPYTKMKKCSRCRQATYCSVECQRSDWDRHKSSCQNNCSGGVGGACTPPGATGGITSVNKT